MPRLPTWSTRPLGSSTGDSDPRSTSPALSCGQTSGAKMPVSRRVSDSAVTESLPS